MTEGLTEGMTEGMTKGVTAFVTEAGPGAPKRARTGTRAP